MSDFAVTNTFVASTLIKSSEVNANFTDVEQVLNGDRDSYNPVPSLVPIGGIIAWHKTFGNADSGQDDAGTPSKLTETGQNFETTVLVGMIVHNTTDHTFANVTAIDSDTVLSLDADIMDNGEDYIIYKTPKLPDGFLECDGSAISDADSPYNGETLPTLNGSGDTTKRLLRGSSVGTGATSGDMSISFNNAVNTSGVNAAPDDVDTIDGSSAAPWTVNLVPYNMDIVWVMRIK